MVPTGIAIRIITENIRIKILDQFFPVNKETETNRKIIPMTATISPIPEINAAASAADAMILNPPIIPKMANMITPMGLSVPKFCDVLPM